jgi:hypothetical protein
MRSIRSTEHMKKRVLLTTVVLLGVIAVVACSDDSASSSGPPDGTNDAGSSGSGTDGATGGDASTTPPEITYETWRLIRNPTSKGDTLESVAANADQVFFSGIEDEKEFLESRRVGSGAVAWRIETPLAAIAANATHVATGTRDTLTLRNVTDGSVVWTKSTIRPVWIITMTATQVIAGGTSFAPYPSKASEWSVQAYDLASGAPAWTNEVSAASAYGDYLAGIAVTADALYFSHTSSGGPSTRDWYVSKRVFANGQPDGAGGWARRQTQSSFNGAGPVVADAQRVYAAGTVSDIRQVVAMNASDGAELWRKSPPATLPFTPGLLFGGTPFLDPNGVMIFGAQAYSAKRSATYLLSAADGAESRIVEHFAGATTAAVSNGHLFVAGTSNVNEAGTDTQWEIDNVRYADGQFSATNHVELK